MTVNSRVVARFGRLSIDIDRVRAAHHLAEEALTRHDMSIDVWYEENLKRNPTDKEFIEYLNKEQKDDAISGYPQVLRSALFTTGYGMLEHFTTTLCKDLESLVTGPGLGDLRGDGIQKARLFLVKVARVTFPDTGEWQRLLLYGKLRNAIVHSQGDLSVNASLKAIKSLCAQEKTFALTDGETGVVLMKEFTPRFLDVVDEFAMQLQLNLGSYIVAT